MAMEHDRPWALLLTWTTWVRLRHPTIRWINFIATPVFALIITISMSWLGHNLNFTQEYGVAHQINGFLQILAPFFIGALAAISSFQRDALDEPMSANPPTLYSSGETIIPTRREFFGYLFGYLAALSVVVYAVGAVAMVLGSSPNIKDGMETLRDWVFPIYLSKLFYNVALVNLICTTFVGLHFLIYYLPKKPTKAGVSLRAHPERS